MTLTVGSLFSGIGGLDLGLERAGMKVIWQSEIDPFANRVLKKHWPEVPNHGDIKKINWQDIERPDVLCGGYPCQPFSTAGKRQGENDPRHLWPWVRTAISELRPRYAIMENVRGHLSMGGLSVIADLASIGYDAEWRVVSAASVGANHRRDRIIIVAYPSGKLGDGINDYSRDSKQSKPTTQFGDSSGEADVANTNNGRLTSGASEKESESNRCGANASGNKSGATNDSRVHSTSDVADTMVLKSDGGQYGNVFRQNQPHWLQGTVGGKSGYRGFLNWQVEPDVGRVADGVPSRVDRLRGLGNAVVPQVAEVVGRLVVAHAETI